MTGDLDLDGKQGAGVQVELPAEKTDWKEHGAPEAVTEAEPQMAVVGAGEEPAPAEASSEG